MRTYFAQNSPVILTNATGEWNADLLFRGCQQSLKLVWIFLVRANGFGHGRSLTLSRPSRCRSPAEVCLQRTQAVAKRRILWPTLCKLHLLDMSWHDGITGGHTVRPLDSQYAQRAHSELAICLILLCRAVGDSVCKNAAIYHRRSDGYKAAAKFPWSSAVRWLGLFLSRTLFRS